MCTLEYGRKYELNLCNFTSKIETFLIFILDLFSTRNNAHGQIGTGDREEATIPKFLEGLNQPIKTIAAGSQHSLAVTGNQLILQLFYSSCI
jgi:alpha-tubulin suppressor-like RCC1 family protein